MLGLLLMVMISKHVVILTEESLVALCFFSFVYYCWHAFGTTVATALADHGKLVEQSCLHALELKEAKTRQNLLEAHQGRISVGQVHHVRDATQWWWQRLHAMIPGREAHTRVAQVVSQLSSLHMLTQTHVHLLQETVARGLPRMLLVDLPQETLGIDQAIAVIARASS